MSTTTLNTKFQLRRDTAANWTATNKGNDPVLADGEPVLAKVDGAYKMKIGDGSSKFSELPYYGGSGGSSSAEKFVVHFTENNDTITADQSMVNIYAAKQAGKTVVGQMQIEGALVEFNMPVCVSVEQAMMIIEFTAPVWIEVPELAILLGYAEASGNTFQGDEWQLSRSEISGGSSGSVSWDNVTNKPFYETVTEQGYNYEIDLSSNYVSGYFNIGDNIPCRFYRVGDSLTASQLLGAVGEIDNGEEVETHIIESNYIDEIEDNGDTVGLFVAGDMPYCLVVNNANTTINYTGSNFGCSGTFASAGTYLFWLDLSSLYGEGTAVYNPSFVKANETSVVQLPDKFYKAPFIVEITSTTENNITTYSANATYSEILALLQAERPVYASINYNSGVLMVQAKALISSTINFSTMAYIGSYIYAVKIEINDQDEVSANLTVFGSAQGVNF